MTNVKDSPEVMKFRALFARLKEWTDDDPTSLRGSALMDEGTKDLCLELLKTAGSIQKSEQSNRDLFTGPVDPKFISEWRDFEGRFANTLLSVLADAAAVTGSNLIFSFGYYEEPQQWIQADHRAIMTAQAFDMTFRFVQTCAEKAIEKSKNKPTFIPINHKVAPAEFRRVHEEMEKAHYDFCIRMEELKRSIYDSGDELDVSERQELIAKIESSLDELDDIPIEYAARDAKEEWNKLKYQNGFDLRGILRRRALIPFVLFPRNAPIRQNRPGASGLHETLRQAHEAFIFGVPFAALALMRSVMETILLDHYRAVGQNLNDYINSVSQRLPGRANAASLHRLRMLANKVLHSQPEQAVNRTEIQLEKDIVSLLFVLRNLIEEAPPRFTS